MKNMKKFITLCGFLILGSIAYGDVDIVKAEAINEQTTDTSGYTITIPSDVDIDKDSGKGSFAVTGKIDAQTELDVSVNSQNKCKLKYKNQEIPYSLDKDSFHINNIKSADMKSFNENFNISLANTNTNYSGKYEDRLTFDVQCHKYTYELDMNSILDGVQENERHNYGSADVYINGILKAENVSDFREILYYGDTYEFKNIKATDGHHFVGINSCANTSIKGRIGVDTNHLWTRHDNPYNLIAPIYFEFNTNKLTINYYPNGAQKHNDAQDYTDSSKDEVIDTQKLHYSASYKYNEDMPSCGLDNVDRFKRTGYASNHKYLVGSPTSSIKVNDNDNVYAKAQDLAEEAKVLSEFKKNDVTINLYPDWTPIQSQLNLNANGGTFSDNSTFKTTTDKLVYDSSSNANISAYTPTRKGYDFDGWYTDETGGTKVYNADGSAVNGTQYWQNNVYQNIEGTNILRGDDGQNMAEHLIYGTGNVVGNVIDNGWVSDSNLQYGKSKKITINSIFTSDDGKKDSTGTYIRIFDDYYSRTNISMDKLIGKRITLSFKIKSDTPMQFEQWGLEGTIYSPYLLKTDSSWKSVTIEALLTKSILTDHRSLVFYSLSTPGSFYIGDVSITLDTDIELFAHWTKKNYSAGTVLNIEGNDYIVMGQTEDGNYRLISGTSIGNMQYQPNVDADGNYKVGSYEAPDEKRPDGQYSNTYEGSYIDNYLENTWYKQLPEKLQKAIQATDIKQASYRNIASNPKWKWFDPIGGSNNNWYYNEGTTENPKWVRYDKANYPEDEQGAYPLNCWKQSEKSYNNTTYNTISRHVFLPSVEEVSNLVDLNNANKVYNFLKGTNNSVNHMWFRDCNSSSPRYAVDLNYGIRSMDSGSVTDTWRGVRPSFVIDLSKVDYTVTGSVNYK